MLILKCFQQWILKKIQYSFPCQNKAAKKPTFSSRKAATLSTQSLKLPNHALFSSAVSTINLISFSFSSNSSRSREKESIVAEFLACDDVSEVSCSDNREIAGPKVGTGVTGGTRRN